MNKILIGVDRMDDNKNHLTRWQVRIYPKLEKVIREKANRDYRSINKTLIIILEEYFLHELSQPENNPKK